MHKLILAGAIMLSSNLTKSEVRNYLIEAGFPTESLGVMTCIAEFESSFNPKAINTNVDGSKDYGLFQINGRWWGRKCDIGHLFDPLYNTKCAKIVYDTQGLDAWVAYKRTCKRRFHE